MIGMKERPRPVADVITISVRMVSGDVFVQPVPVDEADVVQEFMGWFRKPGKIRVWAWHAIEEQTIHLLRHDQIAAVDVEGYIEPAGRSSRWYECLVDRLCAWRLR